MRGSGHRRFVIGVYRMALRVLPADLRRRSGSAIASTFARRLDEAALAAQVWSRLRFALAELADVVQTGARMRFEGLLSRRAVGIMAAGAAVALVLASPASRTALPASGPEEWMDRLESSASARRRAPPTSTAMVARISACRFRWPGSPRPVSEGARAPPRYACRERNCRGCGRCRNPPRPATDSRAGYRKRFHDAHGRVKRHNVSRSTSSSSCVSPRT